MGYKMQEKEPTFYEEKLQNLSQDMRCHPLFKSIKTLEDVQIFMQWHAFAVWDFMNLAKRLQREFTCTTLPWLPPEHPQACRIMNDIILGEESDQDLNGNYYSHFEMYLHSMKDIQSNTQHIENCICAFKSNPEMSYDQILKTLDIPVYVHSFMHNTLSTAIHGRLNEVLGAFFYGREDAIPEMFGNLLTHWKLDEADFPSFVYYLKRHIELDGDSHGPAIYSIIQKIKTNKNDYIDLLKSAIQAVESRIEFWNGVLEEITSAQTKNFVEG